MYRKLQFSSVTRLEWPSNLSLSFLWKPPSHSNQRRTPKARSSNWWNLYEKCKNYLLAMWVLFWHLKADVNIALIYCLQTHAYGNSFLVTDMFLQKAAKLSTLCHPSFEFCVCKNKSTMTAVKSVLSRIWQLEMRWDFKGHCLICSLA